MKRYLPFAIIGGVLVVALAGGAVLWRSHRQGQTPSPQFTNSSPAPSRQGVPPARTSVPAGADNPHFRGAANAKVTLEEYADYQCPSCAALFHEMKILEKDYGSQVRFVHRQFPLAGHKHAVIAARAAEAAGMQGRFWEMHDMIFQNQQSWSGASDARPVFIQYAENIGLNVERFTRDLDSPAVAARVNADFERGTALGVTGTPTLFVNGQQIPVEAMTDEGLRNVLDYVLGKRSR